MYWLQLVAASLHQACAGPGGAGACLGHASTLRYSDTLTSLLAVWVTVLAMAHLPPSLRSANHPTYLHTYLHISTRVSPPRSVLHLTGGVTIAAAAQAPRPQLVGGAVLAASLGLTLVSWLAHSVRTRACSPSSKVSLVNSLLQTYLH